MPPWTSTLLHRPSQNNLRACALGQSNGARSVPVSRKIIGVLHSRLLLMVLSRANELDALIGLAGHAHRAQRTPLAQCRQVLGAWLQSARHRALQEAASRNASLIATVHSGVFPLQLQHYVAASPPTAQTSSRLGLAHELARLRDSLTRNEARASPCGKPARDESDSTQVTDDGVTPPCARVEELLEGNRVLRALLADSFGDDGTLPYTAVTLSRADVSPALVCAASSPPVDEEDPVDALARSLPDLLQRLDADIPADSVILACRAGSYMYNLHTAASDVDFMIVHEVNSRYERCCCHHLRPN